MGRDAAPGQGGRDQRALVQRPLPARGLAAASRSRRRRRGGQQRRAGRGGRRERPPRAPRPPRLARAPQPARPPRGARESFNRRFWYEAGGHLYDVVDSEHGDDAACRPNQIFALSLPHPVLAPERWRPVFETVRQRLLTPLGLRSLAPGEPEYKPAYDGDLRARDAAYHQGTVWAWLIGPFADAWLRLHPGDLAGAHALLKASCRTSARAASAPSPKSSTPRSPGRRAVAWRRPG